MLVIFSRKDKKNTKNTKINNVVAIVENNEPIKKPRE